MGRNSSRWSVGTRENRGSLRSWRAAQRIGALDRVLHRGQLEANGWLVEEREVELARPGGDPPLVAAEEEGIAPRILGAPGARLAQLLAERRRQGAVDRFAVHPEPSPDLAQGVLAGRRDEAIGHGAHVQQVVAPLARDVDELE